MLKNRRKVLFRPNFLFSLKIWNFSSRMVFASVILPKLQEPEFFKAKGILFLIINIYLNLILLIYIRHGAPEKFVDVIIIILLIWIFRPSGSFFLELYQLFCNSFIFNKQYLPKTRHNFHLNSKNCS